MNITQLRTFLTVVDLGSFSSAARALKVSQPAVTMQIQTLESDIGQPLLDRRYRRIDLTEAGEVLLPFARKMMVDAQDARDSISALSGAVAGSLHIAVSTTPGDYIIPKILGSFLNLYPDIRLDVAVASSQAVVELIDERKADVGLVGAQIKGYKVTYAPLSHDELILIGQPSHSLAGSRRALWSEFVSQRWVMRANDSGTQQVLVAFLAKHGIDSHTLPIAVELGTGEAIVNAVEGGLGVAVVSRYVAAKALVLGTVVEIQVEDLPLRRPFYLVRGQQKPSRAADVFVDFLTAQLSDSE